MNSKILIIILGMFLVTYIPRYLPFLFSQNFTFPGRLKTFLSYVPVTALGALILPDAFTAMESQPMASTAGIVFAGIFSYFYSNIFLTVVVCIGVTYITALLLGGST